MMMEAFMAVVMANELKRKQIQNNKGNRILITINVMGSVGPIRLVVNEDDKVANVIDMVLKTCAHEGRFPVLGTDVNMFLLYSPIVDSAGLSMSASIGSFGVRNFTLVKKHDTLLFKKLPRKEVKVSRPDSIRQ